MSFWSDGFILNCMNLEYININYLMDYTTMYLWSIFLVVVGLIFSVSMSFFVFLCFYEIMVLEYVWTVFPAVVLLLIAIPSLEYLYYIENKKIQNFTFNVTGHQWYWNYDYFNLMNFDSYLDCSFLFKPRLLDTDNHAILPMSKILIIITAEDVLHSWSLPSLSVKMDANPGRLNSAFLNLSLPGIFYGNCSEICGANHSFMPIVLEVVNFIIFKQWIINML